MGNTLGIQNAVFQQTNIASTTGSLTWVHGRHTFKTGFEIKDADYSDQSQQRNLRTIYVQRSSNRHSVPRYYQRRERIFQRVHRQRLRQLPAGPSAVTTQFLLPWPLCSAPSMRACISWITSRPHPRLTLEIGLRYDRTPMGHEEFDRQSEISFSTPDPNAGNLPGGTVFAGYGPGRCNCEFVKTYNFGFGPRLSAAYQLNSKTVFRAGWGVSYSAADQWNYLSNNYLTNGMGIHDHQPRHQSTVTAFRIRSSQNGIVYAPSALHVVNLSPGINSPVGALGNPSASAVTYDPSGARPTRVNQWNIALQRQLSKEHVSRSCICRQPRRLGAAGRPGQPKCDFAGLLKADGIDLTNAELPER